jgi:hypothetical protein
MDDDDLIDPAAAQRFLAATRHHAFLTSIVDGLVRSGALPLPIVGEALLREQAFIEAHRAEGLDVRLSAIALENLAGMLRRMLPWPPDAAGLLEQWSLDPREPLWPRSPDNDP